MKLGPLLLVALFVPLTACAGYMEERAIQQASFDHRCAEPQVQVIRRLELAGVPSTVELNVCGKTRRYQQARGVWQEEASTGAIPD